MSRTIKKEPVRWASKEKKSYRKPHYQAHRAAVNQALRTGQEVPEYRRTSGWLTH